ncbi:MAG: DNA polymerase III subunit [Planctomycetota bacterium]
MTTLATLVGHEEPKARMRRTLASGRLASTYLFVGPEGVGKRTFALGLARALLCRATSDSSLDACGKCDSCRMLDAGSHPDLLLAEKPGGKSTLPLELFIGPADKRHKEGLCHDLALRPMVAERRVAIIDDADALSIESANALLKTLEEPPPRSLLVLIGTSLARQLPTIRSRCQVVRFASLSPAEVAAVLTLPGLDVEPAEASELAERSAGSVSEALAAADGEALQELGEVHTCFESAVFAPDRFTAVIDSVVKAAGTAPAARRRTLHRAVRVGIDRWRRELAGGGAEAALASLDALLDAEAAIGRNANQATVTQRLAQRLWEASLSGGSGDRR